MLEGEVPGPGPHVLVEQVLVGPPAAPGGEGQLVLQHPVEKPVMLDYSTCVQCPPVPVTRPQPPDVDILQPRAPHPAQHGEAVTRVVSINTNEANKSKLHYKV